jgi:hypothetical protein
MIETILLVAMTGVLIWLLFAAIYRIQHKAQTSPEDRSVAQDSPTPITTAAPGNAAHMAPAVQPPRLAEPKKLFLSYRREDTADAAGRLHDGLVSAFGSLTVFMDIDSVPLGADFVEHISNRIDGSAGVLVVIGRQWLSVKDNKGRQRLFNDDDFVRTEVAAALRLKVPVIPVLVQGAEMPNADELPEDIRPLTRRNGIELSAIRWHTDLERLIKELDRVMKG